MKLSPNKLTKLPALACVMAAIGFGFPHLAFGLEGSAKLDISKVPPATTPSPEERKAELDARAKAMQELQKSFAERLKRSISPAQTAAIKSTMDKVYAKYGWVPELKMFWGRRDIDAIREGQDKVPDGLLKALVQFKNDLADRGIDLIYIPYPPSPFIQAHLVTEGVGPTDEYYPGWTKMLQELVANDIEVIDPLDQFRAEADSDLLINWVDDFHTASRGRQIAAEQLAERLQRYGFMRSLPSPKGAWTEEVVVGKDWEFYGRISQVNEMAAIAKPQGKKSLREMWPDEIPTIVGLSAPGSLPWNKVKPYVENPDLEFPPGIREIKYLKPDVPEKEIQAAVKDRPHRFLNLKRGPDVSDESRGRVELLHIGDSQLHTPVFGSGMPEFYSAESGALFRWGSKSWSGFEPPAIYQEVLGKGPAPRVVVLSSLVKYFYDEKLSPRPLPKMEGAKSASSTGSTSGSASSLPNESFPATIRITGISKQKDPSKLDYDEALAHNSAVIVGGPHDGKVIGVRYWTMFKQQNIAAAAAVKPNDTFQVTLQPWSAAIAANKGLGEHMVFDDVQQDLTVPIYWIQKGPLDSKTLTGN